jgi:hypothetical protein
VANPNTTLLQLVAAVANGIAQSQAVAGAGNLTLNGSLVTGGVAVMDVARRVLIASAGADSARTFTITGTSRSGVTQSETVTGVASGSSQQSVRDYKTVTSIAVDAATAGNITVGTNGVGSSEWVVDDFLCRVWFVAGGLTAPVGTTYTLEVTYDDPNDIGTTLTTMPQQFAMNPLSNIPPKAWPWQTIVNETGDVHFDFANHPVFAHRLTVTAGTGLAVMQTIQAGVGSGL